MKKTKVLKKELEKIVSQKSAMPGVIEGDYHIEEIESSWSMFSDSARRSIFYVTDSTVITQINAINTRILCNDMIEKTSHSQAISNDSVLNAFEILWNLSNAAQLDDCTLDSELIEVARKMEPGTHLLRIKNEFIPHIVKIIENSLDDGCFEGHKVILPQRLYSTFFPERLLKTWEDFELALAMLLENLLLRAHLDRLTHLYKEHVEQAFKEFDGVVEEPSLVQHQQKRKKPKKKKNKKKIGTIADKANEIEAEIVKSLPIQQPVGNSANMISM